MSSDTPRSPGSTLGRLMRSEGKRGTCKDLQGSRSSEEALMEAGGPGGRGASCLDPQTSDYITYSCFDWWICSCWPHRHHVSILNTLLFPPLLHFPTPPPLFSPCLPPFVHFSTISTPLSRDPTSSLDSFLCLSLYPDFLLRSSSNSH